MSVLSSVLHGVPELRALVGHQVAQSAREHALQADENDDDALEAVTLVVVHFAHVKLSAEVSGMVCEGVDT